MQRQRLALNEAGLDTKKLSSAQRELRQNADETRLALERQQKSLKRLGEQQARMNAVRDQYSRRLEVRDRIAGAGATTTAAGLAMGCAGYGCSEKLRQHGRCHERRGKAGKRAAGR